MGYSCIQNVDLPQIILYNKINGGESTMIYSTNMLEIMYKDYSNINQKISLETKKGNLIRIKKGLYSNNILVDAPIIANVCYGISYISFEYALSRYGLIPEYVTLYTSAVYNKKNNRLYRLKDVAFEYRSIPNEVFNEGITFLKNEDGINYKIATKEKALCDTLYSKYPVRTINDLKMLLFEDLRIDEELFLKLDFDFIIKIAPLYHSNTLLTLIKFLKELQNDNC